MTKVRRTQMATAAVPFEKRIPLKKEDVTCPICWSVLIEPVTLPCKHNLCLVCFKKHVNETALACPCCRKRLSVWSRKACKENSLVNFVFWERIQREFPKLVYARLNNEDSQDLDPNDIISTEDANFDIKGESLTELDELIASPAPKRDGESAAQGEIRQEFEHLYKSHLEDLENQRKREAEASSEFIRKIQEEETQQEAEEKSKLEADLEYAKRIQIEEEARLKALAVSKSLLVEKETLVKKPLCRNLLSEWGPSLTSPTIKTPSAEKKTTNQLSNSSHMSSSSSLKRRSSSSSNHSNKSKNIKRNGKNSSQSSILSFFTNSQDLDTSKSLMETPKSAVDLSNSLLDTSQSSSPQPSTSAAAIAEINASKNLTSSFVVVGLNSSGNTASPFKPILTSPKSRLDLISSLSPVKSSSSVTFADQPNIPGGKGTPDSIHVELNSHFRPIRSAPKTPPKRLADGTYLPEPKIVKTTPIRPSPRAIATVMAPTHNSVFGEVMEESEMDISPSKDSIIPCSVSSSEGEYHPYKGLKMDIVKLDSNDYPPGDPNSHVDNGNSSQPETALDVFRSPSAKLKAIMESNDEEIPDSPNIMPCMYEYEAEELDRFRKAKEQEIADYKIALALEKELNRRPSPIKRNKNSKERYSIRNWLKTKDSSQNSTCSVSSSNSKNESSISTKDKKLSAVKTNNVAISSATITIRKQLSTPKKESDLKNGNDNVSSPLANIVNSHSVNNNLSPYTRSLRSNCKM